MEYDPFTKSQLAKSTALNSRLERSDEEEEVWCLFPRREGREDDAEVGRLIAPEPLPSFLLLSSLELSDSKIYEHKTRALLGTSSHFCEVVEVWYLFPRRKRREDDAEVGRLIAREPISVLGLIRGGEVSSRWTVSNTL